MKISKESLLPIVISAILFIVPFFWLKPGEMDLGGDSSRLYFYDPFSYLHTQTLYDVISSGTGGEAISYYALPYIFLLFILRTVISPTILIFLANGIKLAVAFISCYLIIKELLKTKEFLDKQGAIEIPALLAGLFYVLSPALVNSGWSKAILAHDQIFLNPLMFLLFLRYLTTHNMKYFFGLLMVTFIFSFGFSYVAAPPFFAFYPLSILFLLIYIKYIRKTAIPFKGLCLGLTLFILLQAFHIAPHIANLFSSSSSAFANVFSEEGKFTRGLDYFTAIAPSVKVSVGIMNLPQAHEITFLSFLFIVFPVCLLFGFFLNRKKTLSLTGAFFLITLFFFSANISNLGFSFYKALFNIPGFSMFRNFYGQWVFVYVFFYTLLLGQSLAIIFTRIKKKYVYLLTIFMVGLLTLFSWPLISGAMVNAINHQSNNVKQVIRMDPTFEKVLNFVHFFPIDGKTLTFPLPGPGYQLVQGRDGGAYIGPSTFSYLAGKSDFTGYDGLNPYGELFLHAVRDKNQFFFQRLFSLLNIKYIFYNSDPYIYDDNFPSYPYDYVRDFLPKTQKSYREFLKELPIDINSKIDFGEKYHFYPLKEEIFLPHIYTTDKTVYATDPLTFPFIPQFNQTLRSAVFYMNDSKEKGDNVVLEAESDSPLSLLRDNYHLHRHEPFISLRLDDVVYPFAILREKFELWRVRNRHNRYLDFNLFYLSKRILELERWGEKMPIIKSSWEEPKIWEFYKWKNYNSWEASLTRYEKEMTQLIKWVNKSNITNSTLQTDKLKISEQLLQHQLILLKIMQASRRNEEEIAYLSSLINKTFTHLFKTLDIILYDPSTLAYNLKVPKNHSGQYEVSLEDNHAYSQLPEAYIKIGSSRLLPKKTTIGSNFVQFESITIQNQEEVNFLVHLPTENLLKEAQWQNSGEMGKEGNLIMLRIDNISGGNSGGLVQEITGWAPNKQYVVLFDYITFGDDFKMKISDRQLRTDTKRKLNENVYLEKNLNSKTWTTHQSIVSSDPKSIAAFIQIQGNSDKSKSEIYLKNFSVVEVVYPKVIFKKAAPLKTNEYKPAHILFTKINPTKYEIKVSEAKDPYTLVFLETFNSNWELIDPQKDSKTIRGVVSRFFASIGRAGVSLFVKDQPRNNKTVASYFNGEVQEGIHKNIFLEPETFASWGKNAIAQKNHFRIFGYANAWNINPEDMKGKSEYTLILEMTTQKRFYFFLPLSLLTAVFLLFYLLLSFRKKK